MIDFHTHILPNIDNGSQSIEETFNMINEAERVGFDKILLTPHYIENYYETNVAEREVWMEALSQNLLIKKVNAKLYLGNEIYATENIMNLLENAKASTINNTSYVLLEFPLDEEPENLYNVLHELTHNKLIPVVAHPERYKYVQEEPELVYDLIEKGCLIQMNYGSIIGEYGKRVKYISEKLLQNNLVHFLGTDSHKQKTIYSKIPRIISQLNDLIGEDKVEAITTINPELALSNKKIDIIRPLEVKLDFKEKLLLKILR